MTPADARPVQVLCPVCDAAQSVAAFPAVCRVCKRVFSVRGTTTKPS